MGDAQGRVVPWGVGMPLGLILSLGRGKGPPKSNSQVHQPLCEEQSHPGVVEACESWARPLSQGEVRMVALSLKCVRGEMSILSDAQFM